MGYNSRKEVKTVNAQRLAPIKVAIRRQRLGPGRSPENLRFQPQPWGE